MCCPSVPNTSFLKALQEIKPLFRLLCCKCPPLPNTSPYLPDLVRPIASAGTKERMKRATSALPQRKTTWPWENHQCLMRANACKWSFSASQVVLHVRIGPTKALQYMENLPNPGKCKTRLKPPGHGLTMIMKEVQKPIHGPYGWIRRGTPAIRAPDADLWPRRMALSVSAERSFAKKPPGD